MCLASHSYNDVDGTYVRSESLINTRKQGKRILFIGFIAPEKIILEAFSKEDAPQVSAVKFQLSLLSGLIKAGSTINAISALPISSYPKSKIKFTKSQSYQMLNNQMIGKLIGGVNLPVIKLFMRLCKALLLAKQPEIQRSSEAIIVYSLHTPFLLAGLFLKRVTKLPAVVFIPDLPMHMHGRPPTGLHGLLKRVDNALLKKLVGGFDMAFPFTRGISNDWLPQGMRFQVVDAIAPPSDRPAQPYKPLNAGRPKLLYTGSFTQVARFARLFSESPDIEAELIFAGDGTDKEQLHAIAKIDRRIQVTPFISEPELSRLIAISDFLINPRDSQWSGGHYSFPSKLLDYAFRSKPILSTRLPGIDQVYFNYFLAVDDTDADSLRSSLHAAISLDSETLDDRVQATRKFFEQNNSLEAVAASVLRGIDSL